LHFRRGTASPRRADAGLGCPGGVMRARPGRLDLLLNQAFTDAGACRCVPSICARAQVDAPAEPEGGARVAFRFMGGTAGVRTDRSVGPRDTSHSRCRSLWLPKSDPNPPMANPDQLKFREKFCYGFGDLASVLYWQTFSVYLLYFYTDVFRISAVAAGTMFLISRIWDGVNDPMMGMIADRTETRWGKFRPYLLWMCVPFAIMGVLMFTTPHLGGTGKLVWAYVTFNGMMMLYTAINIPYTSMLGVISPDPNQRTIVSSVKFVFAYASVIVVSSSLLPMTAWLGGAPDSPRGWQLAFIIYGIAAVVFFLIAFSGTRERVRPPPAQKTPILRDLRDLFTNGPWLILFATTITFILFVATRLTITAHYFRYYVRAQTLDLPFTGGARTYNFTELVSAFNTVGGVASLVGALLVGWFAVRVGRKRAFLILFFVSIASTAAFYFLRPDQVGAMFLLQFVTSLTGGPLSVLLWAMYADTADYGEWKNRSRSTGLVFSASTMTQKAGWAIGGFLAGVMLSTAGYVPDRAQGPDVLHGIVLLISVIPAAVGLVSMGIVLFYPLNEERVRQIEADLRARRVAAAPAA
jgi:glycoside/pentoside/hexuronide:cation symporter, GPH family